MLNFLGGLLLLIVTCFFLMGIFMLIFLRDEIKQAYKEWHDEKYGIDFHGE